jgi:chromosomal replication initiation ATPase DnaA
MNPRRSGRLGQQLTLDLPHRPALGRDDFLVSPANQQAVAMIDRWPDWLNPGLVLIGPPGSGKTHLAEVWHARSGARICSAGDVQVSRVPALVEAGALVVENLPGHALDQAALFHLINLTRESGGYLLLTSQAHPLAWNLTLSDLLSRLRAMPSAMLGEPDDELLRGLLVKLFSDRQIAVDETIIAYMLTHMERSAAYARQIVETIDRSALAERAEVTRSFVARMLRESAGRDGLHEDR